MTIDGSLRGYGVFAAALNALMLVLGLKGALRTARWAACVGPSMLAALWLTSFVRYPQAKIGNADTIFGTLTLLTFVIGVLLCLKKAPSPRMFWTAWFLNALLCSWVLAIAFWFRLQF